MLTISLPIADRATSYAFYREALALEAIGAPAADGVPEPLQFDLSDGARLVLVPTGGFGWVVAGHQVAARGQSECLLSMSVGSEEAVDRLVKGARHAGAKVLTEPGHKPWGYAGTFADPDGHVWMVTAESPPG